MSSRRPFACLLLGLASLLLALVVAGTAASQDFVTSATIAGDASAAPVDPAQEPWLRDQAPVVAKPVEISQERVTAAWQGAPETDHARAAALRRASGREVRLPLLDAPAHDIQVDLAAAARADVDDKARMPPPDLVAT